VVLGGYRPGLCGVAVSPDQILTCRHQGGGVCSLVRLNGIPNKVHEQKTYGITVLNRKFLSVVLVGDYDG